jgi:hypothetical protein
MKLRLAVGGFQPADVVKKGQTDGDKKLLQPRGTEQTEDWIHII